MNSEKIKFPKTSIYCLFLAVFYDFGLAFLPVWYMTNESAPLEYIIQLFRVIMQGTVDYPSEFIVIFWLPFFAGVSCLGAVIAAFLGPYTAGTAQTIFFVPLAITVIALVYFFAMRLDIHILVSSLFPLVAAWLAFRKELLLVADHTPAAR